jgi:hypothetical protein
VTWASRCGRRTEFRHAGIGTRIGAGRVSILCRKLRRPLRFPQSGSAASAVQRSFASSPEGAMALPRVETWGKETETGVSNPAWPGDMMRVSSLSGTVRSLSCHPAEAGFRSCWVVGVPRVSPVGCTLGHVMSPGRSRACFGCGAESIGNPDGFLKSKEASLPHFQRSFASALRFRALLHDSIASRTLLT